MVPCVWQALDEMGATRKGCEERRYGVPPTTPAPLRVSSPVVDSSNGEKRAQVEWKGEKSSDGVRSEAFPPATTPTCSAFHQKLLIDSCIWLF
jgi:hypothetical protein